MAAAPKGPSKRTVQRVLGDHQRVGKRLVPPFLARLGELHETSWTKSMVPEILWVALLQRDLGWQRGAVEAVEIGLTAHSLRGRSDGWFGLTSPYSSLTGRDQTIVCDRLKQSGHLTTLQRILAPLVATYPECPLAFLCEGFAIRRRRSFMPHLRELVAQLLDKGEIQSLRAIAGVLEVASRAGALHVFEGIELANLAALDEYPETEASQRVAASLRSIAPIFEQDGIRGTVHPWAEYFWNRSIEIDPCVVDG